MSWYKRKPKIKEPSKSLPYRSSPIAEKILEEKKMSVRGETQPKDKTDKPK